MKKKIIKYIVISLGSLAVLASVAVNIYFFGWAKIKTNYQQQGFNACLSAIIQNVQQLGEVKIGEIILIPK